MGYPSQMTEPEFSDRFREELTLLMRWRRDVRRFKTDAISPEIVDALLTAANLAPSVGNAQPWRFIDIESDEARQKLIDNFSQANDHALQDYSGARASLYAQLKLAGLKEAPIIWAIFTEMEPEQGHGLGRKTMPETLHYSTVAAIQSLWLSARTYGVGIGWVSILDPEQIKVDLSIPDSWELTAVLCIGWPEENSETPELEKAGWEKRRTLQLDSR